MSYPYCNADVIRSMLEHQDRLEILIDCGAVTAYASGKEIKLDDYCRFIEALPFGTAGYMALDVIGDSVQTMANYRAMLERGLKPIPVFTRNTPSEDLDFYLDTSQMVAVGGLATKVGTRPFAYTKSVMERAAGRRVHLLGMTDVRWLRALAPYSADSSSWTYGTRFAAVYLYQADGTLTMMRRWHLDKKPPEDWLNRIREFGLDPFAFRYDEAWRGSQSISVYLSAASWVAMQRDVKRRVGTRIYIAAASAWALNVLLSSYLWQTERRPIEGLKWTVKGGV